MAEGGIEVSRQRGWPDYMLLATRNPMLLNRVPGSSFMAGGTTTPQCVGIARGLERVIVYGRVSAHNLAV